MPRGDIKIPVAAPIYGMRSDLLPWRTQPLESLVDGSNVLVRDQKLIVRSGFRKLDTTGFAERVMGGIFYQTATGSKRTVAGGLTKRKQFNGSTWVDITGSAWTGTTEDHARFVNFPSGQTIYVIGVNGKDATVSWDGAAATDSDLGGGAPIAKDITVAGNRVIYGQPTVSSVLYPYAFMYSSFNDHTVTPAVNIVHVAENAGLLRAVRNLGNEAFAIYMEKAQFVAVAQGGTAPFRVDYRSSQSGPMSPAAVVVAGDGVHYYLGDDSNAYRFDGTACKQIGNAVRAKIQASVNPNYRYRTHGVFDRANREIHWFWTPVGETDVKAGITYNIDLDIWSTIHSFNRYLSASWEWDEQSALSWTSLSGTWTAMGSTYPTWLSMGGAANPVQILGQTAGQTYIYGGQSTDDGDAITFQFIYPLKTLAGDGKMNRVDAVEIFYKQLASAMNLSFRLGTAPYAGATVTYEAAQTFDMSSASIALAEYVDVAKRFVNLRFDGSQANTGLEFHGALVYLYGRGVAG